MSLPENNALVLPWLARGRAVASMSNQDDAVRWLNTVGQHRAARILQKGTVGASATTDSDVATMIGAWTGTMSTSSVFYRLVNDGLVRKLPFHKRIGLATSSPTGAIVAEGAARPISRIVISSAMLQPIVVSSMLVTTKEMLLEPEAEGLFNRELKSVLGQAVDATFIEAILGDTGAVSIPSSGADVDDAIADVRAALLALAPTGDASRLVWLLSPDTARRGSTLGTEGGGVFPSLGPAGGEIRGVVALTSNGIPAGTAALIDCAQIAAASGAVDVRVSSQADVEMSDTPAHDASTPTPANLVSMFQSNSVAMKATATIAATRLNEAGAVLVEGIAWGG